jgi:transaldolase
MSNPLSRLAELGQSIWYDYIRRDLLVDGRLERMIREDRLAGMTSNPTIFAAAIGKSDLYDADLRAAAGDGGVSDEALFETIAIAEIRRACDAFAPVHESSGGRDGYVSIEVSPRLARDTRGTIEAARRLWREVDRKNVMIKIPGTREGLEAIRTCLEEGIHVNVTLLFAIERYREVMEAWLEALERRHDAGKPVSGIASVASFFVSRVDGAVDAQIEKKAKELPDGARRRLLELRSTVAIHNARLAYVAWEEMVANSPRFAALARHGAMVQRPLWASTSTKDKSLPDVLYVEALIGKDTVDTVPPATYEAYKDHGDPRVRIHEKLDAARAALLLLADVGIDLAAITRELEEDGVAKFAASYDELLASIASKRKQIQGASA